MIVEDVDFDNIDYDAVSEGKISALDEDLYHILKNTES